MDNKFFNWGLGGMFENERNELLKSGAIKTQYGIDVLARDGWCVNVFERDEPKCVFEGDRFSCENEADRIRKIKPNAKVLVKNYPKAYVKHFKLDEVRDYNKEREDKELEDSITF